MKNDDFKISRERIDEDMRKLFADECITDSFIGNSELVKKQYRTKKKNQAAKRRFVIGLAASVAAAITGTLIIPSVFPPDNTLSSDSPTCFAGIETELQNTYQVSPKLDGITLNGLTYVLYDINEELPRPEDGQIHAVAYFKDKVRVCIADRRQAPEVYDKLKRILSLGTSGSLSRAEVQDPQITGSIASSTDALNISLVNTAQINGKNEFVSWSCKVSAFISNALTSESDGDTMWYSTEELFDDETLSMVNGCKQNDMLESEKDDIPHYISRLYSLKLESDQVLVSNEYGDCIIYEDKYAKAVQYFASLLKNGNFSKGMAMQYHTADLMLILPDGTSIALWCTPMKHSSLRGIASFCVTSDKFDMSQTNIYSCRPLEDVPLDEAMVEIMGEIYDAFELGIG